MSDAGGSTKLSIEDAEIRYGVSCRHESMPNGELRFRLSGSDGSGYARTVAGRTGGWQNSHKHLKVLETYIVQQGWMLLVSLHGDVPHYQRLAAGEIVTTQPGIPHNVYLSADTVIHTVKHGDVESGDWIACPALDDETKALREQDILMICSSQRHT